MEQILTKAAWKDFDYDNPKNREMLAEALQFSFSYPDLFIPERFSGTDALSKKFQEKKKAQRAIMQMQAFGTLQDFPVTAKEVIDKFQEIPLYDSGFEQIFDIMDFSGSRRDGFSMVTVASGLTFRKVKTGEKAKVFQMSGDKQYVYFDYYGGALNWHRSLFDNQEYWTITENGIEFRNEAYRIRAATYYALLETAANAKAVRPWQLHPDGVATGNRGYTAGRDIATINEAARTILTNCKDKGYGLSAENVTFIVLTPLALRGRIRLALNYQYDAVVGSPRHLDYNFQQVTSMMLTSTDEFMVLLPKKKLKAGYRMDLTTYTDFDILAFVDTVAGWMAYGGAVGDTDQVERCATS